jgi:hypothetical protein
VIYKKPHKYGATKVVMGGEKFDSKAEYRRYLELVLLQKAKTISELERQTKYVMMVAGVKICTYIPDFRYLEAGKVILEDVKGFKTPVFRLKEKLFKALYPELELRITK